MNMDNSNELTEAKFYVIHFHIEAEMLQLLSTVQLQYLNNLNNSKNYTTTKSEY